MKEQTGFSYTGEAVTLKGDTLLFYKVELISNENTVKGEEEKKVAKLPYRVKKCTSIAAALKEFKRYTHFQKRPTRRYYQARA